jgi:glycosyltransferase involved in cell wall biosynthesis
MTDSSRQALPPILFVNSIKFWGGGEQWFLQAAKALAQRGYEVCIAGRRDGVFLERIRAEGLPTLPLEMSSDFSLADYRQLRRWLGGHQNVRILCNLTRDVRLAGPASRGLPKRRILWIMGSILLRSRWRDRFWTRRYVNRFVVPSQALARELMALDFIDQHQVEVLPIGLDLAKWAESEVSVSPPPLPDIGCPIVGVFGRLEKRKGHDVLLSAWSSVVERVPNARLWVAGTGAEQDRLQALARSFGDRVRFWGHVADIPPLMSAVDLVVQPSLYEPFGITLLEAMACAKPIVCTDVGGMPEVVDQSCAVIVPPHDPEALGDAVAALLADEARRNQMGEAGRQRVETQFSLDVMIDQLESLLQED